MEIKKAKIADAEILTDLTLKSKAYWKYGDEQIQKWRAELTISTQYISKNEVYNLLYGNQIIAYYSYFSLDKEKVKLDNMFIHPDFIGKGFGKMLMSDFMNRARREGFNRVELESDPNAKDFYKNLGFQEIGKVETSINNRFLHIMEKDI